MRKRVGITTNPEERRKYWEGKHSTLRDWRIVARNLTQSQAQTVENDYIARGYEGHAGGQEVLGHAYSVYTFEY